MQVGNYETPYPSQAKGGPYQVKGAPSQPKGGPSQSKYSESTTFFYLGVHIIKLTYLTMYYDYRPLQEEEATTVPGLH